MSYPQNRPADQLRPVSFETGFSKYAEGSVLARFGDTHVLCDITLEETLPSWLKNRPDPHGWLTAEYAMLPRSTQERQQPRPFPSGRSKEISRLIGRSLRSALDLRALGERQLTVDCIVLQADGGTRTAAVTGGWLAVALALRPLIDAGVLPSRVIKQQVAAISVGIVDGQPLLDLAYVQDSRAEVDCNVVMTGAGELVEIQATGERGVLSRAQLQELLDLAERGIRQLVALQTRTLNEQQTT